MLHAVATCLALITLCATASGAECKLYDSDLVNAAVRVQLEGIKPVSAEMLERSYKMVDVDDGKRQFAMITIYQGEVYYAVSPLTVDWRIFKINCLLRGLLLNEANQIPDTTFFINLADGSLQIDPDGGLYHVYQKFLDANMMPMFSPSRDRLMQNASMFPLFPDDYSIGSGDPNDFYASGLGMRQKRIKDSDNKPYSEKKKPIMWRGSNTSPHCAKYGDRVEFNQYCLDAPKMNAVNLSKAHPDMFDCKFAVSGPIGATDLHWNASQDNVIDAFGKMDYQKLLVLDGIASTYPGFAYSLMYNAVTLKVEGSNTHAHPQHVFEQWFHSQLVPYRHFYPIDSLSMNQSLHQAYEFLETYPQIAEEIAKRSTEFSQEMLTPCGIEKYVTQLVRGWEEKAKIGSRPPFEGMKRLSDEEKGWCAGRYDSFVAQGLYEDHGTLSAKVRVPHTPPLPEEPVPVTTFLAYHGSGGVSYVAACGMAMAAGILATLARRRPAPKEAALGEAETA